jgi:predicted transcriptional regulator YheO
MSRMKESGDKGELDAPRHNKVIETLQAQVKQLESTLSSAQDINDAHQRYNSKLQTRLTEVEEDNKKLALQIEDKCKIVERLREKGII